MIITNHFPPSKVIDLKGSLESEKTIHWQSFLVVRDLVLIDLQSASVVHPSLDFSLT